MGQVDYRTVCTLGDLAPDKREATITKYFERTQTPNLTLRHVEHSIPTGTEPIPIQFFSKPYLSPSPPSASAYNSSQFNYST